MPELLKSLFKEEWRIHSTVIGRFWFCLFPALIALLTFCATLFIPLFVQVIPFGSLELFIHYLFFFFGTNIGAFGLFGQEIMNRRFGKVSLIAFSSRTLPVSERLLFFNVILKDIFYYFVIYILPFVIGLAAASFFVGLTLSYSLVLLLTLTLSFLLGLALVFLLSTIYAHSAKLLGIVFVLILIFIFYLASNVQDLLYLLPSYQVFLNPSLVWSCLFIIVLSFAISLMLYKIDYRVTTRPYSNLFDKITQFLSYQSNAEFIAKDLLDLMRSRGGFGRIIFSLLLPSAFLWWFTLKFTSFLPFAHFVILFSCFIGIYTSSVYHWITEYEVAASYAFLPVRLSSVIKSKLSTAMLINIVSVPLIFVAAMANDELSLLPAALLIYFGLFLLGMSLMVFLAGLNASIVMMNAKVFMKYLFFLGLTSLMLLFATSVSPWFSLISILPIFLSMTLLKHSYDHWDSSELQNL